MLSAYEESIPLRIARHILAVLAIAAMAVMAHAVAPSDAHAFSLKKLVAGNNSCVSQCQRRRNNCVIGTKNLSLCASQLQRCQESCIRRSQARSGSGPARSSTMGRSKGWLKCKLLRKC